MVQLLIQTSFLGDAILTTPLLAELASRGPVTLVVTPGAAPLFKQHPQVDRLVVYDKRGTDSGMAGFGRLVSLLRAPSGDAVAYLAQGSHRSGALARAAGYRQRIGLASSSGRLWYTTQVQVPEHAHHAERLWRLALAPRLPTARDLRPRLHVLPEHHEAAARVAGGPAAAGDPLIAIAPGSVWATKRWPYYAELARELSQLARIVVVGGADDRPLAAAVVDALGKEGRAIDATGRLSLLESAALIARCSVLVTNDSAPLHLASAVSTPTVAIFGPTVTRFGFGPLAERHEIAQVTDLPCRPCHTHGLMTCPLTHFRCMRDLLPDRVAGAVARVLGTGA